MTKRKKFIPNIWITAKDNGISVIGRTFYLDSVPMACVVNEFGVSKNIKWDDLKSASSLKITFVPKQTSTKNKKNIPTSNLIENVLSTVKLN